MKTKKQLEKEIEQLIKDIKYLEKCNKTFTNDLRINNLARKIILNLFKAEQSPIIYCPKPICLSCNEPLIKGKNIHRGYHIKACKKCRLDFLELINGTN